MSKDQEGAQREKGRPGLRDCPGCVALSQLPRVAQVANTR